MSGRSHFRASVTTLTVAAAFVAGTLLGPSAATAAQSTLAFITNTPANPVPVSVVEVTPTAILASGTGIEIPPGESLTIIDDLDISAYKTVRLSLNQAGAQCTAQRFAIFIDDLLPPESGAFPDCGSPSILWDTPGTMIRVAWTNGDSSQTVFAYFTLVGRP
jgi:hypothetical protein